MDGSALALVQEQVEFWSAQQGCSTAALGSGRFIVPSQREPMPTLFMLGVQSVSAWDHSPQRVGPKLKGSLAM